MRIEKSYSPISIYLDTKQDYNNFMKIIDFALSFDNDSAANRGCLVAIEEARKAKNLLRNVQNEII